MKYPTKEDLARIEKEWFKNHAAALTQHTEELWELSWRRPQSSIYGVRYIISGHVLFVGGDLGEAVYAWSDQLTFSWLATLELGYFQSKCCASEVGREYSHFRPSEFANAVKAAVAEGLAPNSRRWEQEAMEVSDVQEAGLYLAKYFRSDPETFSGLLDGGIVLSMRCAAHLVGLKMAMAQLTAAQPATA